MFLRRKHVQRVEITHKLAHIAYGSSKGTSMNDTTVVVKIGIHIEQVSRDRMVTSPMSDTGTPYLANKTALQHSYNVTTPPVAGSSSTLTEPSGFSASKYATSKIIAHWINADQPPLFRVQWYGFGPDEDT